MADRAAEQTAAALVVALVNGQTDIAAAATVVARDADDRSTADPGVVLEVDVESEEVLGQASYELLRVYATIMISAPRAQDPTGERVQEVAGWVREAIYDADDLQASLTSADPVLHAFDNSIRVSGLRKYDTKERYLRSIGLTWAADQQSER